MVANPVTWALIYGDPKIEQAVAQNAGVAKAIDENDGLIY